MSFAKKISILNGSMTLVGLITRADFSLRFIGDAIKASTRDAIWNAAYIKINLNRWRGDDVEGAWQKVIEIDEEILSIVSTIKIKAKKDTVTKNLLSVDFGKMCKTERDYYLYSLWNLASKYNKCAVLDVIKQYKMENIIASIPLVLDVSEMFKEVHGKTLTGLEILIGEYAAHKEPMVPLTPPSNIVQ